MKWNRKNSHKKKSNLLKLSCETKKQQEEYSLWLFMKSIAQINTKKQYKHLTVFERGQIKALRDAGWTIRAIARYLHRSPSTISRELKRGSVTQMTSEYQTYTVYFPETAQIRYKWERQKCRKPLLLNEIQPFLAYASQKIIHDKWSPDAVVGYCQNAPEWQQKRIPCTKTLYNYMELGLLEAKNMDLPA